MTPQLWIIAGPNGAGKTTLTQKHLVGRITVINPDEIAAKYTSTSRWTPATALAAGRQALGIQRDQIASGKSFAVETTFSGNHELALMSQAKAAGYKISLVYIGLDEPSTAVGRIRSRVQGGGHDIPTADVERRFQRSLENLSKGLDLADRAWLLDNTRPRTRLIAAIERGQVKSCANKLPIWIRTQRLSALQMQQGISL